MSKTVVRVPFYRLKHCQTVAANGETVFAVTVQVGRASTWMSSKTHLVPSSNMAYPPGWRRQVLDTGRISRFGAFRACVLVCETGVELVMGSKSGDRVRAQGVPRALLSFLSSHLETDPHIGFPSSASLRSKTLQTKRRVLLSLTV